MVKKIPVLRRGKVIHVDPQILMWRKRMKAFRHTKSKIIAELARLAPEHRLAFWERGYPRLGGKTPLEYLRRPLDTKAQEVLVLARKYRREKEAAS